MTTTPNIQMDGNAAVQHTNKIMEDGTMNHENNNINMVARFSNAFRMGSISKFVAAATLGLALTIGLAMPGGARADSPLVTVSSSSLFVSINDDFSMVYGIPDNGPGRGASTGASAKVRINTNVDGWNDDFSLVYGTPDAPAKVKISIDTDNWNDDFSMVYGTPDSGLELGGAGASARARVNSVSDLVNDDFSMLYGIPDNGPGRGASTSARAKVNTVSDLVNDDFSMPAPRPGPLSGMP